jgi:hypothetical protein
LDFDDNGLITPLGLEQILEIERDANRAEVARVHNMSVEDIETLRLGIVKHCLVSISKDRQLLVNEGALNSEIRKIILSMGISFRTGGAAGEDYIHKKNSIGQTISSRVERLREVGGVNSDLLVDSDGKRVELKTAAIASPKTIPSDFFCKDLAHLRRQYLDELSISPFDGVLRKERKAEMAILACDKRQAAGNSSLADLIGNVGFDTSSTIRANHGVTYHVEVARYDQASIVRSMSGDEILGEFVIILAIPSMRG